MPQLTVNEAALNGFTHVWTATYEELQTIGNGGQATIATIPAGGAVELAGVWQKTAFAGSTTVVVDVGTSGADPDEFIDSMDVDGSTGPVFNTGDLFDAGTATSTGGLTQAVSSVNADTSVLFEVNDAAIASLTAGELVVGLRIVSLDAPVGNG